MARWSTPLAALVAKANTDVETVVRKVAYRAFKLIIDHSPVDTGRFRANWNFSVGAPDYSTTESTDEDRGAAEAAKALTLQIGTVVYLSNGLPYARRLEYGWSKQAPAGMVRLSVADIRAYIEKVTGA